MIKAQPFPTPAPNGFFRVKQCALTAFPFSFASELTTRGICSGGREGYERILLMCLCSE